MQKKKNKNLLLTSAVSMSSYDVEITQSPNQTITVDIGTDDKGEFKTVKSYTESFNIPADLNCTHIRAIVSANARKYIQGTVQLNSKPSTTHVEIVANTSYHYSATPATLAKEVTIKFSAPGASSVSYTELKSYANGRDTISFAANESGFGGKLPELSYLGNTIYANDVWKDTISGKDVGEYSLTDSNMELIPYTTDATDDFTGSIEAKIGVPLSNWEFDRETVDRYRGYVYFKITPVINTNVEFLKNLEVSSTPSENYIQVYFETEVLPYSAYLDYVGIDYLPVHYVTALLKHNYNAEYICIDTIGDFAMYGENSSKSIENIHSQVKRYLSTRDKLGIDYGTSSAYFRRSFDSPIDFRTGNINSYAKYPSPIYKKLSANPSEEESKQARQEIVNQVKTMVSNGTILQAFVCKDPNNFIKFTMKRL